jgi:hypothetical protein
MRQSLTFKVPMMLSPQFASGMHLMPDLGHHPPTTITPSAGIFSPGRNLIKSPQLVDMIRCIIITAGCEHARQDQSKC